MRAKILVALPLLLFSYFFLLPNTINHIYASASECAKAHPPKFAQCSADGKWIQEPSKNTFTDDHSATCIIFGACYYTCSEHNKTPCPKGTTCTGGKNPYCKKTQATQGGNCHCHNPGSTKDGENGSTCVDANGKATQGPSCDAGAVCRDTPGVTPGYTCDRDDCTCDNANQSGGKTCIHNGTKYTTSCGNNMVCIQNGSKTDCKPSKGTCKCQHEGVTGDGQNHWSCTTPDGKTKADAGHCGSSDQACLTDSSNSYPDHPGVLCDHSKLGGDDYPTIPPPPTPPCKNWSNGQCELVTSPLGDLSTNPSYFVKSIFAILLSFSGGIALLLIMRAGYQIMTSQGKPEQLQNGREQLIAAIVGLSFLILSFVILQVIGYDILRIPGFGQ